MNPELMTGVDGGREGSEETHPRYFTGQLVTKVELAHRSKNQASRHPVPCYFVSKPHRSKMT